MSYDSPKVDTGIQGLDDVLGGGFPPDRLYLIQGDPGVGKTTLGLQFLLRGAERGEKGLYITMSESKSELLDIARSHGRSLEPIEIYEHAPDRLPQEEAEQTVFHPAELELLEVANVLLEVVERAQPDRLVIDSFSELRLLAGDPLHYRRQVLALRQYFVGRACTVLFLDDRTSTSADFHLQSIAHGVVTLEQHISRYGPPRRQLIVNKIRGHRFREGRHDFIIETGGLAVFPKLVAGEHRQEYEAQQIASDITELDDLLCGGLDRGTSAVFIGPAGIGKSSIVAQFAAAAAKRGDRAAIYLFDESKGIYLARAKGLGIGIAELIDSAAVSIQTVDPAELSPGQFVHTIRRHVEEDNVRMVVLDSVTGLWQTMPEEGFLTPLLRELLTYLGYRGVTTLMVVGQHGPFADRETNLDISYLADTVLLFRYYEYAGEVRQAISVFKRRAGPYEHTIRDLRFENGIKIGEPLRRFRGVLTGVPIYEGGKTPFDE